MSRWDWVDNDRQFRRVWTLGFIVWVACLLVLFALAAGAEAKDAPPAKVTVTLDKSVGFAPMTIRIKVTVDAENIGAVCFFIDGPDMFTSSCQPHYDRTTWRTVKGLTAGEYSVWAAALENDTGRSVQSVPVTLTIKGMQ